MAVVMTISTIINTTSVMNLFAFLLYVAKVVKKHYFGTLHYKYFCIFAAEKENLVYI